MPKKKMTKEEKDFKVKALNIIPDEKIPERVNNEEWNGETEINPIDELDLEVRQFTEVNQAKHKTFLRLAKPRVQKILNAYRILGNCSNKSSYDYTQEEIDKMFDAITEISVETYKKFSVGSKKEQTEFQF